MFSDRLQADYETAFKLAIENINDDTSLLPATQLKVIVNKSATLDAFRNIEMGKSSVRKDVQVTIIFFESQMARYYSLRYISLVVVDGHKHCQVHFSDRISKLGIVFVAMRQLKQFILCWLEFFLQKYILYASLKFRIQHHNFKQNGIFCGLGFLQ